MLQTTEDLILTPQQIQHLAILYREICDQWRGHGVIRIEFHRGQVQRLSLDEIGFTYNLKGQNNPPAKGD